LGGPLGRALWPRDAPVPLFVREIRYLHTQVASVTRPIYTERTTPAIARHPMRCGQLAEPGSGFEHNPGNVFGSTITVESARCTTRNGPSVSIHAARRLAFSRRLRCGASFLFALKTRHWTVPIGMALAAAISWYSHSSMKRSVSASCSRESRKDIQC
jgi:hypothetical protein